MKKYVDIVNLVTSAHKRCYNAAFSLLIVHVLSKLPLLYHFGVLECKVCFSLSTKRVMVMRIFSLRRNMLKFCI